MLDRQSGVRSAERLRALWERACVADFVTRPTAHHRRFGRSAGARDRQPTQHARDRDLDGMLRDGPWHDGRRFIRSLSAAVAAQEQQEKRPSDSCRVHAPALSKPGASLSRH